MYDSNLNAWGYWTWYKREATSNVVVYPCWSLSDTGTWRLGEAQAYGSSQLPARRSTSRTKKQNLPLVLLILLSGRAVRKLDLWGCTNVGPAGEKTSTPRRILCLYARLVAHEIHYGITWPLMKVIIYDEDYISCKFAYLPRMDVSDECPETAPCIP